MKFDCEQCGKVDKAYFDGYTIADRQLEGMRFVVRLDDDHKATAEIHPEDVQWFEDQGLSKKVWFKRAAKFAEGYDIFECPKCGGEVIPDDMLGDY